jgi:hypothetical protein
MLLKRSAAGLRTPPLIVRKRAPDVENTSRGASSVSPSSIRVIVEVSELAEWVPAQKPPGGLPYRKPRAARLLQADDRLTFGESNGD